MTSSPASSVSLIDGRYELTERLGVGGMGCVYRALDRLTGQQVALKQVIADPQQLDFSTKSLQDDLRIALANEFRLLASLRHPNVISVLDYGFYAEGYPYYTMDLLESALPLDKAMRDSSLEEKISALIQMLQGIAYLHRRGLIHRDLKPHNVLVNPAGVKVVDFGLAVVRSNDIDEQPPLAGTLAYMAPEVLVEGLLSERSDLYAVGIIAYEVFARRLPFSASQVSGLIEQIRYELPSVDEMPVPREIAVIVGRLLFKEPWQRYQTAGEVIQALCAASGLPVPQETAVVRESFLQAATFVGRAKEMAKLSEQLAAAMSGKGSAWLVGGESGVGKSRLLDELRITALTMGATVLRGQARVDGSLPFELWRDPLRRLVLKTDLTDLAASVLGEIIPDIERLIGRPIAEAPQIDGEAAHHRLTLAIEDLFKRQPQTIVLVLEDLQWAAESLEPLRALTELAADHSWLIVGSYRDDEAPGLPYQLPWMHSMKLNRLSESAVAELSTSMLGEAGRRAEVVDLLQQETEGNAFFLVEVVRALAEEAGALDNVGLVTLPRGIFTGGLLQIVRRRLEQVPERARYGLKLAAVAGRRIDPVILEGQVDSIDGWLLDCANAGVLEVSDGRWRFAHDKLREALLADLSPEERSDLHRHVAEGLEQAYPDDSTYAEALAEHWEAAGENAKALDSILMAADRLVTYAIDYDRAEAMINRALAMLGKQEGPTSAQFYKLLGDIADKRGAYTMAIMRYERCIRMAGNNRTMVVKAAYGMCHAYQHLGRFAEAALHAGEALAVAREIGDKAGTVPILNRLGVAQIGLGDFRAARALVEESLAAARQVDDRLGMASAKLKLGHIAIHQGEYDRAGNDLRESLELGKALGHYEIIRESLTHLGTVSFCKGQVDRAETFFNEALQMGQKMASHPVIAENLSNLGAVKWAQGDFEQAASLLKDALKLSEESRDRFATSLAFNRLGILAWTQGDYQTAQNRLQDALSVANEIRNADSIMHCMANLSLTYLRLNQPRLARQSLAEGLRLAVRNHSSSCKGHFLICAAYLAHSEGMLKQATAWAGLVASQSSLAGEYHPLLRGVLSELARVLDKETFRAVVERGQLLGLDTIVEEVLAFVTW